MTGQKIINGLIEAVRGSFAQCTIDGQVWVRLGDDYTVVPKVPSDDMVNAGDEAALEVLGDHSFALREETLALKVYRAMTECKSR